MDVFIRPSSTNAEKLLQVIEAFGFGSLGLSIDDFIHPGQVIQLGRPPSRIDFLTSISGVSWEEASDSAIADVYADTPVRFIGLNQFIKNKRAIGRHKDLADIETLTRK